MQLQGKNLIYIGGFGGIGEKSIEALLKCSIKSLIIFDLKSNEEYLIYLKNLYKNVIIDYIHMDMSKRETIVEAYKVAIEKVGVIDIVINGAGIADDYQVDLTVGINLTGVIHSSLIAMEHMSKLNGGHGGCIVNISSTVGLDPSELFCIYSATKCAVTAFTRSFASPVYFDKTGVSFVLVCPGAVKTPISNNIRNKLHFSKYVENFDDIFGSIQFQSAETFAQEFIKVLAKSRNGTTWVIENGSHQEIHFKNVWHPLLMDMQ